MKVIKCSLLLLLFICFSIDFLCAQADTITVQLNEVVATGSRNQTEAHLLPMTISVVTHEQLSERHETNILPTLSQEVPGLFITQRGILGFGVSTGGSGGIKIRGVGGSPNTDVLVLIDGLPQYAGLYGHPVADNYQTMMTERVEVIRGPASLYYGSNAMGGVINIVTLQPQTDTVVTSLHLQGGSYYTIDAGATNQVRRGRFSSSVGANYSRTDGHRDNMDFDQYSGFLRLAYEMTEHWQLNATGNITYFNSSNPGTITAPIEDNDMHILRGMATFSALNHYDRTSGAIRVFYSGGKHRINDGYQPLGQQTPQTKEYLHTDFMAGISLYQTANFFRGNQTTFGIDMQYLGGHAWNHSLIDNSDADIIRAQQFDVAGYVDFRQQITSWFTLDAGIRLDWHSTAGLTYIPQAGMSFILPADVQLKALLSRGVRNPTIRELYMYAPANDELRQENQWNYELSYKQYLLNNRLILGANIFYLHAQNMIETRPIDGRPLNVNTGEMHNAGCELELRYNIWKGLHLSANYSYLWMRYPQLAAPQNMLNVAIGYKHERFSIGTSVQYIQGLYTILPSTDAGLSDAQTESFVLWNAHANFRVYKELWVHIKADNLLASRYEINAGFPMPRTTVIAGLSYSF